MTRQRNDCTGDDLNIQIPAVKDNLKASITNKYNRSDMEEAKRRKKELEKKLMFIGHPQAMLGTNGHKPLEFHRNLDSEETVLESNQ